MCTRTGHMCRQKAVVAQSSEDFSAVFITESNRPTQSKQKMTFIIKPEKLYRLFLSTILQTPLSDPTQNKNILMIWLTRNPAFFTLIFHNVLFLHRLNSLLLREKKGYKTTLLLPINTFYMKSIDDHTQVKP